MPRRMYTVWIRQVVAVLALLAVSGKAFGQGGATLKGRVTDARDESPIDEADVTLFGVRSDAVLSSTITDASGWYRMAGMAHGTYRVEVRVPGYRPVRRRVTLEADEDGTLSLALHGTALDQRTIVTAPSRRAEDVRHAPASVAVVESAALQRTIASSSIDALRAVPGVSLAQTGLDRRAAGLRGFNRVFSADPLVVVDDRPAGLPALGANVFSLMPIQLVDVKRMEVVRGPAAALYGPAASAGVIHVITKDPFEDPGTTVAFTGGARSFLRGQFRHAADIGGTFGYEVIAHGARGTNWQLDPTDPADQPWLAQDYVFGNDGDHHASQIVDPATGQLLRDPAYWKAGIRGRLAYRLGRQTTIAAQGGYASVTSQLLSEVGALQARFLGYSFGQLRVRSGGLFAQVVLNNNEAGESYVYGTGQPIMDRGVAYGAQLRYRFEQPDWATAFTVGADGNWTRPRTGGTLIGRYEARDAIDRYGAYGYANTALSTRLSLALALRADIDNLSPTVWPAARAGLVYDVTPAHTMRLRYERAAADLQARKYFLDMTTRRQTLAAPYDLVYRAQGAVDGFTFHRYRSRGRATSLLPGAERFGQPLNTSSMPLRPLYETAAARFEQLLMDPATRPAAAENLSSAQIRQLATSLQALMDGLTFQDRTEGALGVPHGGDRYRPTGPPRDVAPLARPIVQTLEVGYHGQVGRHAQISADVYLATKKNTIRPAEVVTPLVYASLLERDLTPVLTPLITQANNIPNAPLGDLLETMGLSPSEAAQLAAGLAEQALDGVPVGVIQPDQPVRALDASTAERAALITYRNADRIRYVGANARVNVQVGDRMKVFGALSLIHPGQFMDEQNGAPSSVVSFPLNAPPLSAQLGVDLDVTDAWTVHVTGHYASRFSVRAGLYAGIVAAAYPLDVGLRYDAQRYVSGLQVSLSVRNALGQTHRGFVGAPAVGRMALARIAYAL